MANVWIQQINHRLLGVCCDCGQIVRIDKPLIGSAHFCTTPEERQKYPGEIRAQAQSSLEMLRQMHNAARGD